jgi:anti-sigma B factor antagonist
MLEEDTPRKAAERAFALPSRAVSPLTIEVTEMHDRTCVMLLGELDDMSAPILRERLADLTDSDLAGDVVLDIAGVSFVDSTGLSLFIQAHKNLAARDRQLILFHPTPMAMRLALRVMARRLLMITGLDSALRIEPDTP